MSGSPHQRRVLAVMGAVEGGQTLPAFRRHPWDFGVEDITKLVPRHGRYAGSLFAAGVMDGRDAAMIGGKPPEQAGNGGELVLATVASKDAEEVGRDRIERKLGGNAGKRLGGVGAADPDTPAEIETGDLLPTPATRPLTDHRIKPHPKPSTTPPPTSATPLTPVTPAQPFSAEPTVPPVESTTEPTPGVTPTENPVPPTEPVPDLES